MHQQKKLIKGDKLSKKITVLSQQTYWVSEGNTRGRSTVTTSKTITADSANAPHRKKTERTLNLIMLHKWIYKRSGCIQCFCQKTKVI